MSRSSRTYYIGVTVCNWERFFQAPKLVTHIGEAARAGAPPHKIFILGCLPQSFHWRARFHSTAHKDVRFDRSSGVGGLHGLGRSREREVGDDLLTH